MADNQPTTTQQPAPATTAAPASPATPPATPASAAAAPAPVSQPSPAAVDFGKLAGVMPDDPAPDPVADAVVDPAANKGPASAGQPSDAAVAQPPASNGPGVEIEPGLTVPLPPEIAASLDPLEAEKPKADPAAPDPSAVKPADDATLAANIVKMLKPTGQETPEQVEQNAVKALTEKERFIGKQAAEVGDIRKHGKTLAEKYILPLWDMDPQGQPLRLSAVKFHEAIGKEELARQLAEAGVELVPVGTSRGEAGPSEVEALELSVADSMRPGTETPAEKLEILQNEMADNTKLKKQFEFAVRELEFGKRLESARKVEQEREKAKAAEEALNRETGEALAKFETLPHKETLRAPMKEWAARLDGKPITGRLRIEVLRGLGEFSSLKQRIPQIYSAGFKEGIKHAQAIANGTLPSGGVPISTTTPAGDPSRPANMPSVADFERAVL